MDRDKVVKWMEQFRSDIKPFCGGKADWERFDAGLALLKEKEPKEVKDKSKRIKFLDEYFEGECPSCRSFLDEHSNRNFCGYCGQEVKWE